MTKAYFVLAAAIGLTLTACGNKYGSLCADSVQCEGGNDADVDACVARANAVEDVASAYDCGDAYAKLSDCVEKTSICGNKHFSPNCKDQSEALKKCEDAASGQ